MINTFGFALAVVLIYMTLWFVVSVIKRRNDVVDLAWGSGFIVMAVALMVKANNYSTKMALVATLVTIWGLRLTLHIWPRLRRKSEDFRYAQWRKQWGKFVYLRSFFQVFVLQGVLMVVVGASIVVNAFESSAITPYNWLGVLIWGFGFIFETTADRQLSNFLTNPNNKSAIMDHGLWKYSRHPNYFGEVTQWWGLWLIVIPSGYWWLALVSPLTITVLILFVSGIPLLEKKFMEKPGYKEYAERTSAFFPLPPRFRA